MKYLEHDLQFTCLLLLNWCCLAFSVSQFPPWFYAQQIFHAATWGALIGLFLFSATLSRMAFYLMVCIGLMTASFLQREGEAAFLHLNGYQYYRHPGLWLKVEKL